MMKAQDRRLYFKRRVMASWLGQNVCVHWDDTEGMEGEGWKLEDDQDGFTWFVVDYGYAVRLDAITAAHKPEECPRFEGGQ